MPGEDSKYSLMVAASLDLVKSTKNLQDDLNKIAPNLKLELQKVGIGAGGAKELEKDIKQSVQKSTGGKGVEVDVAVSSSSMQAMEQQLALLRSKYGAIDSSVVRSASTGEATAMTVKYTDAVGKAITQTYRWNKKKKELTTTTFKEVDAEKQLVLQMERYIATAKNAMAATHGKDQSSKEVQAIKATATELENMATQQKEVIETGGIVTSETLDNLKKQEGLVKDNVTAQKALNNTNKSFGDLVKNNTIKVIQWAVATTALYGSIKQLRDAIGFISQLNQEMTNIRIVSGQTEEEVRALAITYNRFAKELGTTTNEVARASLEFIRQGKTVEETQSLLRTSTMMSKLANLDAAMATEYTTSIMNGFKLTAEDMIGVLDVLVDLDNKYATSVGEIALAMQRSSTSAQIAGVSLNELASYITIVSSVTRRSASSIGESFKTMFARMQDVKLGKDFDEQGESISNVDEVLAQYGISLRNASGDFRDLGDILDNINEKWETLERREQSQIAKAIAGVRQRENFLVLMENYDQVLEAQEHALNSAGMATERYGIYLENIEAKVNIFRATWEELWTKTISTDEIKTVVDMGTAILKLANNMGGLIPITGLLVAAITALKFNSLVKGVNSAIASLQAFKVAMIAATASPVGLILLLSTLALVGVALYKGANSVEKYRESIAKLNSEISSLESQLESSTGSVDRIKELGERFEELDNITQRTNEEQQEWLDIQKELYGILPGINGQYDEAGNFLFSQKTTLRDLLVLKRIEIHLLEEELRLKRELQREENLKRLDAEEKAMKRLTDQYNQHIELAELYGRIVGDPDATADARAFAKTSQFDELEAAAKLDPEIRELANSIDQLNLALGNTEELEGRLGLSEYDEGYWLDGLEESARDATDELNELIDSLNQLASAMNVVSSAEKEMADNGYISNETAVKLVASNKDLASTLSKTSEGYLFNAEAAREMAYAEMYSRFQKVGMASAAVAAANGNYVLAASAIQNAQWLGKEREALLGLLNAFAAMSQAATSLGGGGGGGGKSPRQKEIEDYIDSLEDEKDALKDRLNEYKKWIEAQKKALKLQKEEQEFLDKIAKKNKELSKLKTDIAILALDDSEEAKAKRLKLEEEAANLEEEIQEDKEDRIYELQIQALDNALEAFEAMIQAQMDALDDLISKYREEADALSATGGAAVATIPSFEQMYNVILGHAMKAIELFETEIGQLGQMRDGAIGLATEWAAQGRSIEQILDGLQRKYQSLIEMAKNLPATGGGGYGNREGDWMQLDATRWMNIKTGQIITRHEGGLVEKHHDGGFAGGLKSNEVYAKLLEGEYVANEQQMNNFLKNTLPALMMKSTYSPTGTTSGVEVYMPITVNGDLDRSVLPDLDRMANRVIDKINTSMTRQGHIRQASKISI